MVDHCRLRNEAGADTAIEFGAQVDKNGNVKKLITKARYLTNPPSSPDVSSVKCLEVSVLNHLTKLPKSKTGREFVIKIFVVPYARRFPGTDSSPLKPLKPKLDDQRSLGPI
jgi:hypothetical protein